MKSINQHYPFRLNSFAGDESGQIYNAVGVAPLVVIPRDDFYEVVADNHRRHSVDCRRSWIAFREYFDFFAVNVQRAFASFNRRNGRAPYLSKRVNVI